MRSRVSSKHDDIRTDGDPKALGAYYTARSVAEFLVRWAVRTCRDHVLDPSFGDGVFLEAAWRRLAAMGGRPARQVHGVELSPAPYRRTLARLTAGVPEPEARTLAANLVCADFFDFLPGRRYECVIGNPPFIRYQRFRGAVRKSALQQATEAGVALPALASSWAPFLVKSAGLVAPGGRLAMVAPLELGHAAYAGPVISFLHRAFGHVTFLTFRRPLFPQLSEDTLLVLADDRGAPPSPLAWVDLEGPPALDRYQTADGVAADAVRLRTTDMLEGRRRLLHHLVDDDTLTLYERLQQAPGTRRLGELVEVGTGYVTGANDFFHLSPDTVKSFGIDERFLVRAVRRGRSLAGILYTTRDWVRGLDQEASGWLLKVPPGTTPSGGLASYLEQGVRAGIPERYKCRVRRDWYAVPHVYEPLAFLTYMSGFAPKLVANQARAVATNSLHILRPLPSVNIAPETLALRWYTSLTWLSAELEGHPMGGGMLKLEPGEARQVLIAVPPLPPRRIAPMVHLTDALIREGDGEAAVRHLDLEILENALGLSRETCERFRAGAATLRARRTGRGR